MKFNIVSLARTAPPEALILLCTTKDTKGSQSAQLLNKKLDGNHKQFFNKSQNDFKGGLGETMVWRQTEGPHIIFLGLGQPKVDAETLRKASGSLYDQLKTQKISSVMINTSGVKADLAAQGFTEGLLMSSYEFTTFKAENKEEYKLKTVNIAVDKVSTNLNKTVKNSEVVAEAVNFARWLGDCPGNFMTPTQLGEEAKSCGKGIAKLKVTVWDKKRIEKEKMDSLIGVSLGSAQEPKFIIMEYKNGPAKQKPLCLVGKGLTFDCGGISIKPSAGMEEMKFDMCGSAAVIGAMKAIANLGLKVNVMALVPSTENMPGPAANKPGDIRKARNGKSIEINNTDAEGRLILADALCYASEQKPGMILDAATLTGAMVIALGNIHTGFYTRNNSLRRKIESAGNASGELIWPMPLVDEHSKDMKGHYADVTNLAPSRGAGSATAAAFLEYFVDKDIPWAHFDVAGTAWHAGNRLSYAPKKGASGSMVRTFVEIAKAYK